MPSTLPPRSVSLLPEDFAPGVNHPIIGRGKKHSRHPGNLRYSELVHEEMHAYAAAENKAGKSEVISRLVARVRETGNFVREAGQGRWSLVEEHAVRTTTAQHFRDALYNKYRSSKEMKKQKRKEERRTDQGVAPDMFFQDDFGVMEPCKKRARCVSPERANDASPGNFGSLNMLQKQFLYQQQQQQQQQKMDYLAIFSNVFTGTTNGMDMHSNPFEPTPIRGQDTQSVLGAFVNTFQSQQQPSQVDSLDHMPFFEVDETRLSTFQAI